MPVKLNSTGGGSVTLTTPSTASDFTATFPANTGNVVTTGSSAVVTQAMLGTNVAGTGPTFSAYNNNFQTISAATVTKVTFNTEEYDTANCFASSRFTPNVAGYYLIIAQTRLDTGGSNTNEVFMELYKNGALYRRLTTNLPGLGQQLNGSALIYMNGTTDYVELYFFAQGTGTFNIGYNTAPYANYIQGFLARAA